MGTAVERFEIVTAFALLLVALFVAAAGTLAWAWEAPGGATRRMIEQTVAAGDTAAQAASAAGELFTSAISGASSAASQAFVAVEQLPGGGLGVLAALVAGALGVPVMSLTTQFVRRSVVAGSRWRMPASWLRPSALAQLTAGQRRIHKHTRAVSQPRQLSGRLDPSALPSRPQAEASIQLEPEVMAAEVAAALHNQPTKTFELNPVRLPLPKAPSPATASLLPRSEEQLAPVSALAAAPQQHQAARIAAGSSAGAPLANDEDRALTAAQEALAVLTSCGAHSPLLAIDTFRHEAQVMLDLRPQDQAVIERAFAAQPLHSPHAELRWAPPSISVRFSSDAVATTASNSMAVPLLQLGRRRVRWAPLGSWRHLGIYGGDAHAAAHHVVASLLCQRRPDELGLAVLDRLSWASLYRNTPHWVDLPGEGPACADALARALRRGVAAQRPVLLVLVDPDGATLSAFSALMSRLSLQPSAPLHIMLVQRRLQPAGRQLYLALPALITAGEAAPELLPAVRRWPRGETASVLVRGQRWSGRPYTSDEAGIGELARRLARYPRATLPVLWQTPEGSAALPDRPEPPAEHCVVVDVAGS